MSLYSTDFSEYSTGAAPSDWTDRWATSWSTNVESSSTRMDSSFGAQVLELDPTADARKIFTWDDIDADANRADSEVLVRFQLSTVGVSDHAIRVMLRASGAVGAEYGYYLYVYQYTVYLTKYVNGTATAIAQLADPSSGLASYTQSDNMPVWFRLRANGTSLKGKFWTSSIPEPDSWQLEDTDSDISAAGWVGIGNYSNMSTRKMYVDYFAVGTNGDSPALPTATTGNVELGAEHIEVAYTEAATEVQLGAMHTEVAYAEAATEVQLGAMHIEVAHGTEPNLPEPPVQSMETLMLESFSGYGPSLAEMVYSRRWVRYSAGAVPSSSAGREGGWGLRFNVSNSQWYIQTELVKAVQTIVIGVAVNYDVMPTGASYGPFFLNAGKLWDRDPQLTLMISAAGKLQLRRGNATGTLLEEGTTVLAIGNWYFIELRAYIHDTAGNYEVRINEVTEMSGTSVDTQAVVGDNTVRNVYLSPGDFVSNTSDFAYFDSLYIRGDATGDFAGGFLGNVLIESVVPDDNGVYRQWTRSTGTEDYTLIDETPEDDTDYLYASVAGSRITTNFVDLTGADEIKDVMAYHFMSGKSGGMRNIKPFCRNGGNHVDNGSHISRHQVEQPGVSYPYDPATNVAWTVSGFNSAEFGVEAI